MSPSRALRPLRAQPVRQRTHPEYRNARGRAGRHRRRPRRRAADRAAAAPVQLRRHRAADPAGRTGSRYVGQALAAVVADTPKAAEDLAEAVFVDIEPEDPVGRTLEAALTGATCIRRRRTTCSSKPASAPKAAARRLRGRVRGGVRSALAAGRTPRRSSRAPRTPPSIRATGRVTLTARRRRRTCCAPASPTALGMAEADLRVIAPDVGGGFGQKMSLFPEYVVLVWLARHSARPPSPGSRTGART